MLLNSKYFHLAGVFTHVTASVCVFLFLSTILLMLSNGLEDNNGYYCAISHTQYTGGSLNFSIEYKDAGKVCGKRLNSISCTCSSSGDPRYGSPCDP